MKRMSAFSLGGAFIISAALCAPVAHASTSWSAIAYKNDSWHGRYTGYGTKTSLIVAIQNGSGTDAGYVTFPSGQCGALVSYVTAFDNTTQFATGTGDDIDSATNQAINKSVGRYTLLDAFCWG